MKHQKNIYTVRSTKNGNKDLQNTLSGVPLFSYRNKDSSCLSQDFGCTNLVAQTLKKANFYNCGHFLLHENIVLIMALIAWNYMGEKSLQFADIYDDIYETL